MDYLFRSYHYLARYDKLSRVDYSELFVKPVDSSVSKKRLVVLNNNISLYQNNLVATPYLNWDLAESTFHSAEYYETVTEVFHNFKQDPPEVILDDKNLLAPFFDRLPEMRKKYEKRGAFYYRTSN
jgi:hypothetical protein